jgi:hypothetical protein
MSINVTLNNVGSLLDATTAANTINQNNGIIKTALANALSTDGEAPNQMQDNLDMNSNQILNLPTPATNTSPLRLQDLTSFVGGGTITNIPTGGTTGQALKKTSNTNFATSWQNDVSSVGLSLPIDFTVTNSPVTSSGTLTGSWTTAPTGSGAVVRTTNPTLTSPTLVTPTLGVATATSVNKIALTQPATGSTLTIADGKTLTATGTITLAAGTDGLTYTFPGPAGGTVATISATQTFTNKTIDTTGPNTIKISGATLSTGQYPGETSTGNATAGNMGEYISSTIVSGSAVSLTSGTAANVTSISLTAGDWDIDSMCYASSAASTSISIFQSSVGTTSATMNLTAGNFFSAVVSPFVPGTTANAFTAAIPPTRFSLSGTTTIFLVVDAFFTVSTLAAWGILRARRAR